MKIFIKGKAKAQRIRGMGEHFNAAFLKICLFKPYRGLSILCSLGGLLPHPLAKKNSRTLKVVPNVKEEYLNKKQSIHKTNRGDRIPLHKTTRNRQKEGK